MTAPHHKTCRTLAYHRLVALLIRREPQRFEAARALLAEWRTTVDNRSQPYLREWEWVMAQGIEATLALALEESEHASTLRSCSPLIPGQLTPRERLAFLDAWSPTFEPRLIVQAEQLPAILQQLLGAGARDFVAFSAPEKGHAKLRVVPEAVVARADVYAEILASCPPARTSGPS